MHTQRVNAYLIGSDPVFYIEEYSPEISQWVTVGATYDSFGTATAIVEKFNMARLADAIAEKVA